MISFPISSCLVDILGQLVLTVFECGIPYQHIIQIEIDERWPLWMHKVQPGLSFKVI
ncbi:hypothetical protein M758_4G065600 [Ceratodon purpureus]|uniref:Uncharacterized protein n=1 Tax=Ceratodon purpureus TaxID=3225 RepID=A0A8T0H0G4_CERPU|nr:hypothetical protein KC19_8G125300 [Ceratodon purpureus]KAG0618463.1 hypothetical protein M758_4G065600 [Ceratodon purpureus]